MSGDADSFENQSISLDFRVCCKSQRYAPLLHLRAVKYLLSFAAGAMLYVVVEELIPEMSQGRHSNLGTVFFAVGFSIMMVLDVALG